VTETTIDSVYLGAADRVAEILRTAGPTELGTTVAACPDWTVHDLGAHLEGGVSDILNGRTDGVPGRKWTARHVAELQNATADDLADQLVSGSRRIPSTMLASVSPTPAWDLLVHEGDLRETLGLPIQPAQAHAALLPDVVQFLGEPGRLEGGVRITTDDHTWMIGDGSARATVHATDYELLRILFSRRSRRQIETVVDGDSEAVIGLGVFGPRDDDQPLP